MDATGTMVGRMTPARCRLLAEAARATDDPWWGPVYPRGVQMRSVRHLSAFGLVTVEWIDDPERPGHERIDAVTGITPHGRRVLAECENHRELW